MLPLKLIVDNTQKPACNDHLLAKAVQAYWRACENETAAEADAIKFLAPLRAGSPSGLAQKAQVLQNMVETQRPPEQIAGFAASIADDALSMSRLYLTRAN